MSLGFDDGYVDVNRDDGFEPFDPPVRRYKRFKPGFQSYAFENHRCRNCGGVRTYQPAANSLTCFICEPLATNP